MAFFNTYFLSMALFLLSMFHAVFALAFNLPDQNTSVLGQVKKVRVGWGDDFHSIAQKFDVGFDAMVQANPQFHSKCLPLFYKVLVPAQFILPQTKRQGIVINVAEKRLFYYDTIRKKVFTYPIGIGKVGWLTPLGVTRIIEKIKQPTWHVPKSVLKALREKGYKDVPSVIPPGPQDPLGDFAMRLAWPLYLIHRTNAPHSIGTQASSGCIRLFPKDIAKLFKLVAINTPVTIIDKPYLLGWQAGALYLAVYVGLSDTPPVRLEQVEQAIFKATQNNKNKPVTINWRTVAYTVLNKKGIPTKISVE